MGKAPSWLHKGLGLRCGLVALGEAAFVFCPGVTRMIGMGGHTFLDDKSHLVWDQRDGSVSEGVLVAKPDCQRSVLRLHEMEVENQPPQVVL